MIALIRTELFKAACRMRTLVIGGLLVGLPTLIVFAIKAHGRGRSIDDNGVGLFRLAQLSGYLVPGGRLERDERLPARRDRGDVRGRFRRR